ncbi:MAG: ester cyclase [Candidatus Kariarchaeaceae archaeon]|jgi:steroid delta-isomerase-like uncharacterized protein
MAESEYEKMVRQLYADFDDRTFMTQESWGNMLADDFIWLDESEKSHNKAEFTGFFTWLVNAFPDIKAPIEIFPQKGNSVAVKYTCKATFTKDFKFGDMEFTAHGKSIAWTGIDLYEFENDKINKLKTYLNPELFIRELREE